MKKEMEEERKMLRMAEVLREERVQMKLKEAKLLLEQKILELEVTKQTQIEPSNSKMDPKNQIEAASTASDSDGISGEAKRCVVGEKSACNSDNNVIVHSMAVQRKASPEPENPHIRRGIKGFVEFPRVARAIGSKNFGSPADASVLSWQMVGC
ncbi:hypothetical protein F0562_007050 [Nyssa sinensis]|uniref:Uncharacterized protein n=1 Tax=Nyssa sinensis TaxID=561372 RepID=A0A5J5A4Y5_9ASTE|nr:hypothetical protein F0562_007050 [Nyssa sinensis]